MPPQHEITMAEALRLTRAGQLREASALLQRGLAAANTAPPAESTTAGPRGGLGHLRLPLRHRSHDAREAPGAYATPALDGVLDRLKAKLPGLRHIPRGGDVRRQPVVAFWRCGGRCR